MRSAVRPETILNVNDDERSRRLLSRLLRRAGYHVREGSSERSLRVVAKAMPEAVVLGGPMGLAERRAFASRLREQSGDGLTAILHLTPEREVAPLRRSLAGREGEAVLGTPADAVAVVSLVAALLRARDAELTAREARPWQVAFDAIRDGICVTDMEGRLFRCNRAMAEVVGRPMGEMLGRTCGDLLQEARERVFGPLLARMAQTRARESVVLPVRERWYRATLDPLPHGAVQPTGAVLSVSDVTEQVRAETARARLLEVERARARDARILDLVFESTPSLLAYIDRNLRYVRVNARYAECLGRTASEIIGRTVEEVLGQEPSAVDAVKHCRDTGEPLWLTEMPPIIPPSEEAPPVRYDVAVTPIRDDQGEVEGLVISVMDVSEKVRLREEQVERERASRQFAEALSADISHRVKNSLMLLAGLLQMQISRDPESEAAVVLRDTIARLLTVADLHARLNLPSAAEVDLLETVRRIAEIIRQVFATRNVDIAVEGESLSYPSAAVNAISVAVNELVTNAIKHGAPTEDDRLRVQVQLGRHGEMLCVNVWNSGNPVPEGFNIDDRTHLGLRLVRDLAALRHRGSLTLRPHAGGTLAEMHLSDESLRAEA